MRRHHAPLLVLAVALLLPLAARADTVRLKNGRAYEGVIAERTPQGVRVKLSFGLLVIPNDQVLAVEKAPSALAEYLARREMLAAQPLPSAAGWLELARWAKVNDMTSASREAALTAAELDPRLTGLDAMLRPLGLVYESALGRWIPYEESMARRGLVRYEGEWMSTQERRERLDQQERRRAAFEQQLASQRLAAAAEAMQRREEELAFQQALQRQEAMQQFWYPPLATFPGVFVPTIVLIRPPRQRPPGSPPPMTPPRMQRPPAHTFSSFTSRQPGSFLPVAGDPIVPPEVITPPGLAGNGGG
ncbi:MAG TPA: hypothetical protein VGV61_05080 [Thermoanaerobaculia bacterium]|jgi:hypothetical protein|nr:hypothetical protein [Thermoanaerobaculia bacterium]